ncbi:MAG: hypothetical protein ACJAVX_004079 [Pseudoalteromonas rhizosphaerae]|jgi:hypothetical protein
MKIEYVCNQKFKNTIDYGCLAKCSGTSVSLTYSLCVGVFINGQYRAVKTSIRFYLYYEILKFGVSFFRLQFALQSDYLCCAFLRFWHSLRTCSFCAGLALCHARISSRVLKQPIQVSFLSKQQCRIHGLLGSSLLTLMLFINFTFDFTY